MEPTGTPQMFKHERLDDSKKDFRLFRIVPQSEDNGQGKGESRGLLITCHIETFDASSFPVYQALSYVWGPPHPRRSILINGATFEVRENLFLLLHEIATRFNNCQPGCTELGFDSDSWLWCDQICIDQSCLSERNYQVSQMGFIYAQAVTTIAWLGWPRMSPVCDPKWLIPEYVIHQQESRNRVAILSAPMPRSVEDLANHEYWTRLWIVQELWLSRDVKFLYIGGTMGWSSFVRGTTSSPISPPVDVNTMTSTSDAESSNQLLGTSGIPLVVDELVWSKRLADAGCGHTLGFIIETFGHLECQDPRDKVFGLLGLVKKSKRIPVDYSWTVEQLYLQVLAKVMSDDKPYIGLAAHMNLAETLNKILRLDLGIRYWDNGLRLFLSYWEASCHLDELKVPRLEHADVMELWGWVLEVEVAMASSEVNFDSKLERLVDIARDRKNI